MKRGSFTNPLAPASKERAKVNALLRWRTTDCVDDVPPTTRRKLEASLIGSYVRRERKHHMVTVSCRSASTAFSKTRLGAGIFHIWSIIVPLLLRRISLKDFVHNWSVVISTLLKERNLRKPLGKPRGNLRKT